MLINADFSRRAAVSAQDFRWVSSPQAGVERVMLDRVGGEVARATSFVRYAAGSHFPRHVHGGGEEILVLEGTFSADAQHYPAGWYLRSPPGSSHQPFSEEGAMLFVKLCQMPPDERREVRIDTRSPASWVRRDGRQLCPLHESSHEKVWIERLQPGQPLDCSPVHGMEMLVLDGALRVDDECFARPSWIRVPAGEQPRVAGDASGATLYVKTGHLGVDMVSASLARSPT